MIAWDEDDKDDLKDITPAIKVLRSLPITETNLRYANHNLSNYDEVSKAQLLIDYLNDFVDFIVPRIINRTDWRVAFEKHYSVFEAEYLSDKYRVVFFAWLRNFSYTFSGTGVLDDDDRITYLHSADFPVSEHEHSCESVADYYRVRSANETAHQQIADSKFSHSECFLRFEKTFSKKTPPPTAFNVYDHLRKFMLGIRCLKKGSAYIESVVYFMLGNYDGSIGHGEAFPENVIDRNTLPWTTLGESPTEYWLRGLWRPLKTADYGTLASIDQKIEDSLKRNTRGKDTWNPLPNLIDQLERLADIITAFDGVYQTIATELKDIIAKCTAQLMSLVDPQIRGNIKNQRVMRAFIVHMYEIRSAYEHGHLMKAIDLIDKYFSKNKHRRVEEFKSGIDTLEYYLQTIVMIYCMNPDLPKHTRQIKEGNLPALKTIYNQ